MSDLDDIWHELFEARPSPLEEKVLRNLASLVDPEDTSYILCVLVVRFLSQSLLLDPSSPVNLAGRLGRGLRELNERIARFDELFVNFDERLVLFVHRTNQINKALDDARKFVEKRSNRSKILAPKLAINPHDKFPEWQHSLSRDALSKIGWRVFWAAAFGIIAANTLLSSLRVM